MPTASLLLFRAGYFFHPVQSRLMTPFNRKGLPSLEYKDGFLAEVAFQWRPDGWRGGEKYSCQREGHVQTVVEGVTQNTEWELKEDFVWK